MRSGDHILTLVNYFLNVRCWIVSNHLRFIDLVSQTPLGDSEVWNSKAGDSSHHFKSIARIHIW
jgi:hypothetical protein